MKDTRTPTVADIITRLARMATMTFLLLKVNVSVHDSMHDSINVNNVRLKLGGGKKRACRCGRRRQKATYHVHMLLDGAVREAKRQQ